MFAVAHEEWRRVISLECFIARERKEMLVFGLVLNMVGPFVLVSKTTSSVSVRSISLLSSWPIGINCAL